MSHTWSYPGCSGLCSFRSARHTSHLSGRACESESACSSVSQSHSESDSPLNNTQRNTIEFTVTNTQTTLTLIHLEEDNCIFMITSCVSWDTAAVCTALTDDDKVHTLMARNYCNRLVLGQTMYVGNIGLKSMQYDINLIKVSIWYCLSPRPM